MRRSTARLQILPWNLGPVQGDLQFKLISGRCWFHPSQFHVAEAYQRAVLFNKDTFEEEGHRLHSLVCSCATRLRVGTRKSGCSGTVPVDTTPHRTHILLTPSAFYAVSLFLVGKLILLIKHLETNVKHVQCLTWTRNVWLKLKPRLKDLCHVRSCALFAEVSFISCAAW